MMTIESTFTRIDQDPETAANACCALARGDRGRAAGGAAGGEREEVTPRAGCPGLVLTVGAADDSGRRTAHGEAAR